MIAIGMPGGPELILIFLILGLPTLIVVGALIDILKSEFDPSQNKLIWVLVTILMPVIGAILYFAIGRSQRISKVIQFVV